MAEKLGELDLTIKAEERQVTAVHRKAGKQSGADFARVVRQRMAATATNMAQMAGGARAAGAANLVVLGGGGVGRRGAAFSRLIRQRANTQGIGAAAGTAARGIGALATRAIAAVPVIGWVIAGIAAFGLAIRSAIKRMNRWSDEMRREAQRLAAFSAPIAGAMAGSAIGGVQRDIRRAQVLGPTLAATEQLREIRRNLFAPISNIASLFKSRIVLGWETLKTGIASFINRVFQKIVLIQEVITRALGAILRAAATVLETLSFGKVSGDTLRKIADTMAGMANNLRDLRNEANRRAAIKTVEDSNRYLLRDIDFLTGGQFPGFSQ